MYVIDITVFVYRVNLKKIVEKLLRNNSIMVLKQDKDRRIVVVDRKTYRKMS